jgi:hypothetical protein
MSELAGPAVSFERMTSFVLHGGRSCRMAVAAASRNLGWSDPAVSRSVLKLVVRLDRGCVDRPSVAIAVRQYRRI